HAEGLKGPLLSDRRPALPHLEGVLRRRGLGLLGDAPGPALPQLQDALGLRGIGGAEARRALLGRGDDGALAAGERAEPGARGLATTATRPRRRSSPS